MKFKVTIGVAILGLLLWEWLLNKLLRKNSFNRK